VKHTNRVYEEIRSFSTNIKTLQTSLSYLIDTTSKCESIWSRFIIRNREEFDLAVKYINETTIRGMVESTYYVVEFYHTNGFYPNESKKYQGEYG
jgi:hypothetical protein